MFEDRLKDILIDVYCGRIIVFSNYTARETLIAKGISPAIFLHKYYAQMSNDFRISYNIKDKTIKEMFQTCPIDAEQYDCFKDEKVNKVLRERVLNKSKLPKEFRKEDLDSKLLIQNYLKSLNFFWFEEASKTFIYAMSLDESNFKLSTLQQPVGMIVLLELEKGQNLKTQYEKIRKEVQNKMKKMFLLNPNRVKNIPTAAIILHNLEKGVTQEECQSHLSALKQEYRFQSNLICKVEINGPSARDSIDWSSYPRAILKIDYKLQASDPIRLFGESQDVQLKNFVFNHRQRIRAYLEERIRYLGFRYEQNNTTKNKFFNFFKGSSNIERGYNPEQVEMREIADFLFLLGDYKKSLEIYKDLAQRFQPSDRDQLIFFNLSEMIQLGKCMHAFFGGQRMKAYDSIKSYAQKTMLKRAHGIGKQKLYRYLVYITYFLHGFRIFDKEFIKNSYYYYLKKGVNDQTPSEKIPIPSIMPALIHQQYANINLLYPIPEHRRYGYDIVRVSSKFNQFKMYDHHLRCLLIASYIYKDTFPILQKYINSSLSRTYLELKKYRFSLERIQLTWKNLITMYEDVPLPQVQQQNQFSKLYSTQLRAISEIQRFQPNELTRQTDDCIQVPKISDVKIDVFDERLDNAQSLGSKWQDVGDVFLGEPELTSKGMSKQNMMKTLKMFDAITAEQKELAYRIKGIGNGPFTEPIIKRNVRSAYVGEPITFSFSFKNPLPINIEVSNINLHLKNNRKCQIVQKQPALQKLNFKSGQKINLVFQILPYEIGVYEFSHITWTFFKMTSIYRFLQPWESKSNLKSFYFKLNVLDQCAKMSVKMQHGAKIYQGQKTELDVILRNQGNQPIQQIYAAIDNFNIFGFNLKRFDLRISPGESETLRIKAKMPILKHSDFLKCITKAIFLYRSSGQFRVQRAITCFNVQRIADVKDVLCERISKSLLFLSFSLKYPSVDKARQSLMKSLIIQGGFQIKKVQTNNLDSLCHYFFFLKKNQNTEQLQEFKLVSHSFPALNIISEAISQAKQPNTDQNEANEQKKMRLYFWWCDNEGREGIIHPKPIMITATQGEGNRIRLPFNVKVLLKDEIQCNFQETMFVELQVDFSVKNIFDTKDIKVTLQFKDGELNEFYWQGKVNHQLVLKYNEERRFKLNLLVMRSGVFNVAKNIRYTIFTNKTSSYSIAHNEYESVYLEVRDPKNKKQNVNFDFFEQFQSPLFKKALSKQPTPESFDLI